jgi:predicted phosphodiesterase
MKILIAGDIHQEFGQLNALINVTKPDITIQAGDNAYFWAGRAYMGKIKSASPVYLVPGNHEDWDMIDQVGRRGMTPILLEQNIYHCPIGSSIEVNGKKILFVGGADSIDKAVRQEFITWWRQETLNNTDLDYILANVDRADIIVSHTCPDEFKLNKKRYDDDKFDDPTQKALSYLLHRYKPSKWFFGHFHSTEKGQHLNTKWTMLNMSGSTCWWKIIEV